MAPWNAGGRASVGDGLRQESVALQGVGAREFTGIDIRLAGVSRGVDHKLRPHFLQKFEQNVEPGVVNLRAFRGSEGQVSLPKFARKGLTDISAGAKKKDHGLGFSSSITWLPPGGLANNRDTRNFGFWPPAFPTGRGKESRCETRLPRGSRFLCPAFFQWFARTRKLHGGCCWCRHPATRSRGST